MAQASTPQVITLFPFIDEYDLLRQYFLYQENLSEADANRFYSDSKLQAAQTADPRLYAQWVQEAHAAFEALCNSKNQSHT